MSLLPNLQAVTTVTTLQSLGNANSNGAVLDLQPYKGPVTFVQTVTIDPIGAGNIDVSNIETSADNSTFTAVTNGAFAAVINAANTSNCGTQLKTFDVRDLSRYVRCRSVVSGANANTGYSVIALGQKERV